MLGVLKYFWGYFLASVLGKMESFLSHMPLPRFLRSPILHAYASYTGSRVYEMNKPISEYPSISSFFIREIKARPIDTQSELVAPVDCTILSAGRLEEKAYKIEQVKGIDYPMQEILGLSQEEAEELTGSEKPLYYLSIHLPVSECHRFRSPADWVVKRRTHVPGTMLDLSKKNMFGVSGVLYNERVVLEGEWAHGKFFFVPVGSRVVGSIVIDFDKRLRTNYIGESFRKEEEGEVFKEVGMDKRKTRARALDYGEGVRLRKGQEFGRFEGGSAFVAVFQHPDPHLAFTFDPPQFLLYGNALVRRSDVGESM